jgi:hypothetical protein
MAALYIVTVDALGDYHKGSIIAAARLGDAANVQRLLDLGAIAPAPEGSTPVRASHWGSLASYDDATVRRGQE